MHGGKHDIHCRVHFDEKQDRHEPRERRAGFLLKLIQNDDGTLYVDQEAE
jgi:hypothetical protein